MTLKGFISISFALLACVLEAQHAKPDTIMSLDTVNISAERYSAYSSGQKLISINAEVLSEDQSNNIGDILNEHTSVYVRSYGGGSISSMSFRGTSSNQSSIFWNGINIRMPSLGSSDLSLIPAPFFENASIVFGGSSIRYGSGTIGGAVFLDNKASFDGKTNAAANFRTGSFGYMGTSLQASSSGEKIYVKLAFTASEARNDYLYKNIRGEEKRLDNAKVSSIGLNIHAAAKLGPRNQLDLFFWYQEALREIPPTLSMSASDSYQSDRAGRSSIQWKRFFDHGALYVKTAWFSEYENFTDPSIALQSSIKTNTYFIETEYRHQLFKNASMDAGISFTVEMADIDAYGGIQNRDWIALFVNYKQYLPKIRWNFVAGARQEISGKTLSPFTPSIGIEGPIAAFLSQKLSVSRNYRLPSMNELYWQPGGKPDIKPESSWNAEFSLLAGLLEKQNTGLHFVATAYSSYVSDWILWLPKENFWTADNIKNVWARGVELSGDYEIGNQERSLQFGLSYTFSRSTNESSDVNGDSEGKQLIYTPLHNASARLKLAVQSWKLIFISNYSGMSYTTSDNLTSLPGYYLADIALHKKFKTRHIDIGLVARINNLFNKEYEVVAYRPMPGTNFNFSLTLNFNN